MCARWDSVGSSGRVGHGGGLPERQAFALLAHMQAVSILPAPLRQLVKGVLLHDVALDVAAGPGMIYKAAIDRRKSNVSALVMALDLLAEHFGLTGATSQVY